MKRIILFLGLAGLIGSACATATEAPRETSLASEACEAQCDCTGCTDDQVTKCEEDLEKVEETANDEGCDDELEDYLSCVDDDAQCIGGFFDTTVCTAFQSSLMSCLGTGTCAYQGDGKCDEPEGTGLCAEGTDGSDCTTTCVTTYNGICDEPQGTGSGLCPFGSDYPDCSDVGPCEYQGDGYCDEPEGSGLCADGTDPLDCSGSTTCSYTNDGVCDEPEGTGWCDEGTDVADCSGSTGDCSTCYEYGFTDSTDPLCPGSEALWNAVVDCICFTDCASQCTNACNMGELDAACDSCVTSYCTYEMDACAADI